MFRAASRVVVVKKSAGSLTDLVDSCLCQGRFYVGSLKEEDQGD